MKYFIIIFSLIVISCKNDAAISTEVFNEIKFKNDSLELVFKNSVDELTIPDEGMGLDYMNENLIIEFYRDSFENYDTIIAIKNCPPTSVRNLIQIRRYKNFKVYIYCEKYLLKRFSKLVDIGDAAPTIVTLKPINDEGFECIYERNYKLDDNQFIKSVYNYE